jgi:hypothetical protein
MEPEVETSEPELSLAEAINLATRRMATALIVAGMAIGLGLWARPSPPHYQAFATADGIVRVNQKSGTVILCRPAQRCAIVLRQGQQLEGGSGHFSFGFSDKPDKVAPPSAPPAPALRPSAPASPAPAPAAK